MSLTRLYISQIYWHGMNMLLLLFVALKTDCNSTGWNIKDTMTLLGIFYNVKVKKKKKNRKLEFPNLCSISFHPLHKINGRHILWFFFQMALELLLCWAKFCLWKKDRKGRKWEAEDIQPWSTLPHISSSKFKLLCRLHPNHGRILFFIKMNVSIGFKNALRGQI